MDGGVFSLKIFKKDYAIRCMIFRFALFEMTISKKIGLKILLHGSWTTLRNRADENRWRRKPKQIRHKQDITSNYV